MVNNYVKLKKEGKDISPLELGNLDAKRDFTDIRDVVAAYWQIVNEGIPGQIYNVCVGKSISIQNVLDKLIIFSERKIPITVDPSKLRKSDVPDFIGYNKKLRNIGWTPKYTIEESLDDLLKWIRALD